MVCGWCKQMSVSNKVEIRQVEGVRFCSESCAVKFLNSQINSLKIESFKIRKSVPNKNTYGKLSDIKNVELAKALAKCESYSLFVSILESADVKFITLDPEFDELIHDLTDTLVDFKSSPANFMAGLINIALWTIYQPAQCDAFLISDLIGCLNFLSEEKEKETKKSTANSKSMIS